MTELVIAYYFVVPMKQAQLDDLCYNVDSPLSFTYGDIKSVPVPDMPA